MAEAFNTCENVMIGHATADKYKAPTHLALRLSESLCKMKKFDASRVMSHYLYLYHETQCHMGEASRLVYEELRASITIAPERITRQNFKFTLDRINMASNSAHRKLNGLSAGCNPAQRSFPLAYCPWINDESLFEISCIEARLTHFSELAGQVAGLVNLICRRLLKGDQWDDAVNNAFATIPNPSGEMEEIRQRYRHDRILNPTANAAYAPATLHTALHCVTNATSFGQAIDLAKEIESDYCPTIVGILAGARWAVPESMLVNSQPAILSAIREVAKCFNETWNKMHKEKQKALKKKAS